MARDFQINGEALVYVKFGAHLPASISNITYTGTPTSNMSELGLARDSVRIMFNFNHQDIMLDDYGPNVPAEVLWNNATCNIQMVLIHYDANILDYVMSESMGGTIPDPNIPGDLLYAGVFNPVGTLLGGPIASQDGSPRYLASGWHYTSLNIASPQMNFPYHFPKTYLSQQPIIIPLGTEKSMVELVFRALPYQEPGSTVVSGVAIPKEYLSSGAVLWNHILDDTATPFAKSR